MKPLLVDIAEPGGRLPFSGGFGGDCCAGFLAARSDVVRVVGIEPTLLADSAKGASSGDDHTPSLGFRAHL
jgi:hypothetical protein